MGELAILLRNPPSDDDPTRLGIAGPLTHATTPILRDYLRRLMDTTAGRPRIVLDMSCCTGTGIDVDGLLARVPRGHHPDRGAHGDRVAAHS